jgi:hypothetical protein
MLEICRSAAKEVPTGGDGQPDVLATIEAIATQPIAQAEAGADIVGPASMLHESVSRVRAPGRGWPRARPAAM